MFDETLVCEPEEPIEVDLMLKSGLRSLARCAKTTSHKANKLKLPLPSQHAAYQRTMCINKRTFLLPKLMVLLLLLEAAGAGAYAYAFGAVVVIVVVVFVTVAVAVAVVVAVVDISVIVVVVRGILPSRLQKFLRLLFQQSGFIIQIFILHDFVLVDLFS